MALPIWSWLSGRKSQEEKNALSAQSDLAKTEGEASKFGLDITKQLIPQATSSLNQVEGYYGPLLKGDRQQMLESVAPEVNSILSQYDTAKRAVSEFSPRGGGRTATLADLPFRQAGDITTLLQRVRPESAKGMTDISQTKAALSGSFFPRGTSAAAQLLQNELQRRGMSFDQSMQQGAAMAEAIIGLLG